MHSTWSCQKCTHTQFETDEISTTGSGLSRLFDIQNKKYTTFTYKQWRYTEFYKGDSSMLNNILDFFVGG